MMKLSIKNKDVNSIKADTPHKSTFELYRLSDDYWSLLEHSDGHVRELLSLETEEWEVIWKMLTAR